MKKNLFLLLLTILILNVHGQNSEKKAPLFGLNFTGLIKTDFIFDSRQNVTLREGSILFFPEPAKPDAQSNDINAKPNFSFLCVQTKGTLKITGPDALGAKTSGFIEAEFFGNINTNMNVFRLRHAFVKLNWSKAELLIGQYWHPMYEAGCTPEVISADAGLPFKVYARNPQLRFSRDFGRLKLIGSAMAQIDFCSNGPEGPSPKYLRNSFLPEMNLQVQYLWKNEATGIELQTGAGVNYMVLTPLISTEVVLRKAFDTVINNIVFHNNAQTVVYKTDEKAPALSANIFFKLRLRKLTTKVGGIYSQNGYAFSLLGGYGVKSVTNSSMGFVDYANINTMAFWADMATNGQHWQFGFFGGYTKNLGASTELKGPFYSRGCNIDYMWRISPRVLLTMSKIRFALETEYTVANYGTITSDARVVDSKPVENLRLLLSAYYFF